jgi:murein DD-endopeptidase MepM/ murein hydrolase activator NlpD
MKNEKYYYNPQTLQYEKVKLSWIQLLWRILGFVFTTLFAGFILMLLATSIFQSPREVELQRELEQMEATYQMLENQMDNLGRVLKTLEERDNNIYRVIFEAEPIPGDIRRAGFGGNERFEVLKRLSKGKLMEHVIKKLEAMERQLYVQSKSYDELVKLVKNKEVMLASIPAIQPVSNKDLKRLSSGFGRRIDPIYKTVKMHEGLDFTAPTGTPIYATGDGVVKETGTSGDGYGIKVVINHGYGYETLYAHCSKVLVRKGKKVKRGDMIAYVGNTGKSTAPHLHYEVIKNGRRIDPINFFFNDLTPEEYEQVLKIAAQSNQSFD